MLTNIFRSAMVNENFITAGEVLRGMAKAYRRSKTLRCSKSNGD